MKKIILLFLLSSIGFAQNINQYNYALVPSKFSFLKENNQYNLNLISKLYLKKFGFEAYFDNEDMPNEFASNNCNKVFLDVISCGNLFTTKLKVILKDCKNKIISTSPEGKSGEKEFQLAYNQALRMAFDNWSELKAHNFQPAEKSIEVNKENEKVIETKTIINENLFSPATSLFAKPTAMGYQLLTNNTNVPVLVLTLQKTSLPTVFIASENGQMGVLIQKNNQWYFEYYVQEGLVSRLVNISF